MPQNINDTATTESVTIECVPCDEFGTLYQLWHGTVLLGVFYQELEGQWVSKPHGTDCCCFCDTEFQAQIVIMAIKGLIASVGSR